MSPLVYLICICNGYISALQYMNTHNILSTCLASKCFYIVKTFRIIDSVHDEETLSCSHVLVSHSTVEWRMENRAKSKPILYTNFSKCTVMPYTCNIYLYSSWPAVSSISYRKSIQCYYINTSKHYILWCVTKTIACNRTTVVLLLHMSIVY